MTFIYSLSIIILCDEGHHLWVHVVSAAVGHSKHRELIENLTGTTASLQLLHAYAGRRQLHGDRPSHGRARARARAVVFGGGAPQ